MINLYNFILKILFCFFVLSCLLNSLAIYPFEFFPVISDATGNFIRINHIAFVFFFIWLVAGTHYLPKKLLVPILVLLLLIFYSIIVSFLWWNNYYIINYIWSLVSLICSGLLAKNRFTIEQTLKLLTIVGVLFYLLVTVKNIIYLNEILIFFSSGSVHPLIPSLVGGGLNIEATMLSLMALFSFRSKRLFYILLIISFLFAVSYSSRVGIISSILVLFFVSFFYQKNKLLYFRFIIIFLIIGGIIFYILSFNEVYIIERFSQVGNQEEAGSSGRLNMWVWIIPALSLNMFGYGAGNAINAISYVSNFTFLDNNIHLYPMQVLLDFGLLGFAFYIYTFYFFAKKTFTKKNNCFVFYCFIFIYLILGFIQFKGGEPMMFLIVGFALSYDSE